MYRSKMLQTQDLRVDQINEPCIGLTQENLIENFVQDHLPYMSRSLMVDFIFYFLFSLYFIFIFIFILFSIFRTTQVRVYQSCCHISHKMIA